MHRPAKGPPVYSPPSRQPQPGPSAIRRIGNDIAGEFTLPARAVGERSRAGVRTRQLTTAQPAFRGAVSGMSSSTPIMRHLRHDSPPLSAGPVAPRPSRCHRPQRARQVGLRLAGHARQFVEKNRGPAQPVITQRIAVTGRAGPWRRNSVEVNRISSAHPARRAGRHAPRPGCEPSCPS